MELEASIDKIYQQTKGIKTGTIANYIPQLACADPDSFAISVATTDGRMVSIGDSGTEFSIQSTSKPFCFALALEHFTIEEILAKVGVEPTGEDFNAISKLDRLNRPMNPMVNSGAISICSLLQSKFRSNSQIEILEGFSRLAGRNLRIDDRTYKSEWETTDGNRAITYLLKQHGMLSADPDETIDLYVKTCSLNVTTEALAMMGATLANNGVHPKTASRCIAATSIRPVLSVMLTCGMYNYAGQWVYEVGLPAKSGISGSILMIVPGVMAVAVYSPLVGRKGASVRGAAVCKAFSELHKLHLLEYHRPTVPTEIVTASS